MEIAVSPHGYAGLSRYVECMWVVGLKTVVFSLQLIAIGK